MQRLAIRPTAVVVTALLAAVLVAGGTTIAAAALTSGSPFAGVVLIVALGAFVVGFSIPTVAQRGSEPAAAASEQDDPVKTLVGRLERS